MRHSCLTLLLILAGVIACLDVSGQISGATSPNVGTSQTYTFNNGTVIFNPQWRLSLMIGTITSQTQSGTSYSATITWNSTGSETVAFFDGMVQKAQLTVNVMAPPPPVPTASAASNVSSTSFSANWGGVSGAASYRLDVSTASNFAAGTFVTGFNNRTVSGLTESVTGLTANTPYYYRVRSASATGNTSASSNVITVTTGPSTPTASAATSILANSFSANWGSVAGATNYAVDVSTSSSFSSVTTWNSGTTTVAVNGLTANTTYYYRVRASNSNGTSGNSNTITVVTPQQPPAGNAATAITSSSFTANWGSVAGATQYLFDLSTASDFSSFVGSYNAFVTTGLNVNLSGLSSGTTYYYRVRAQNSGWTTGYSNVVSALTIPGATVALPAGSITTSSFLASWNAVTGATGYVIDVVLGGTAVPGYTNLSVAGTSTTVSGILPGNGYTYRVRAVNASGQSVNSNDINVTTTSMTVNAATAFTTTSFSVSWVAVAGASGYRLDVSAASDFSTFVSGYNNLTVTGTSQSVTGLTAGTTYYYRVRTVNGTGTSPGSATVSAVTLPVAPVLNAISNVSYTFFTITWAAVTSATSYRLDVSTVSNFASFVSGYNNLVVNATGQNVTGLSPGVLYYYRVRAVNGSGNSASSATASSATNLYPPVAIAPTSVSGTAFTANWNTSVNATSYRLDVSNNVEFTSFFSTYNNLTVSGTTQVVTGLLPKKTYYYRVRAVNSTGTSANSNTMVGADMDINYIRTIDVTVPGKTDGTAVDSAPDNAKVTTHAFYDGLGRPLQTVVKQGSPSLLDVVQPNGYDIYGREAKKYLPYTDESTGWFKPNSLRDLNATGTEQAQYQTGRQYAFYQTGGLLPSDQYPFAESRFEASPANRPVKQGSPGLPWQPDATNSYTSTDRTMKFSSEVNALSEVLLWTYTYPTAAYPLGRVSAGTAASPVYYGLGQLTKTRTKDEQHNEVIEYKDNQGKVVLKRVQAVAGTPAVNDVNYASTYYIYDGFGNLVCVIPPQATTQLATNYHQAGATDATKNSFLMRWAFRYTYDASGRMTQKQVPGSAPVFMIYDKRDRLVLTQDGNQRSGSPKYWTFTKYDALNRPVATGMITSSSSRTDMQNTVDTYYANLTGSQAWFESYVGSAAGNVHGYDNKSYPQETGVNNYLSVTYYDSYSFRSLWTGTYTYLNESLSETANGVTYTQPTAENARVTGLVTGTKVKVLDGGMLGGSTFLKTITYYDDKSRVIQVLSDNVLGGLDRLTSVLDFTGKVLESKTTHTTSIPTSKTIARNFEYDLGGRLIRLWHRLDSDSTILLAKNDYNELGQLIDKKLHNATAPATNPRQSVDYRYNIRGWLTSINNSDVSTIASGDNNRDHFGMELGYNASIGTGNTGVFNGNISGMKWSVNQGFATIKQMAYNFVYDPMNRLTTANSFQSNGTWSAGQYDENGITYDLNGNIKALQRKGLGTVTIDNLSYDYGLNATASNMLQYVQDNTAIAKDKAKGFVDGNTGTAIDYTYDSLGNMTRDLNKGIGVNTTDPTNKIAYNYLNLPETVTKGGNIIKYIYDATGRKLAQLVTSGSITTRTDYDGEFVYENNALQFVNHEEGRIVVSSTKLLITDAGESTSTMTASNATLATYTSPTNDEKYIKVTASNTTARAGVTSIGGTINVAPNERYRIRVKGYRGTNAAYLSIKTNGTTDLNWPGVALPPSATTESWIEQTVTIPAGATTLQAGVTWSTTVTSGDAFYINEFEITQLLTTTPEYQYHLKDHLGNIRVTFTTKNYNESATATLETANMASEQSKFLRYQNAKRIQAALFDRTNGASTGYSQRLNGSTNEKYGLAKSISVMPGDKLNIEVYAKYVDTNSANWNAALTTLMTQIANNTAGVVVDGASYATSTSSFPFAGLVNTTGSTGGPKAYLNYILFDRNFVFKTGGYKRLSAAPKETGTDVAHERLFFDNLQITEPGIIYIFLSNEETSAVEVFFDDFKVEHIKSAIVSAQDYYPFGLTFNSYSRENSTSQDYKYNGKEEQSELGLGWLDYGARFYMPDLGKWGVIDPLAEKYLDFSTYQYVRNNPVSRIDPDGRGDESKNGNDRDKKPCKTCRQDDGKKQGNGPPMALDVPITEKSETKKRTATPSNPDKAEVVNRPYDVQDGVALPSIITATDENGNEVIVKIEFGPGFSSDQNHTPNNLLAPYAVEGYIEGVRNAIANGTNIQSLTINATTNAHHGEEGAPNWDVSSSNHYVRNGGDAIDTGKINGMKATKNNPATAGFQKAMKAVSNISENFGATYRNKNVGGHNTWVHTAFKPK